MARDKHNFGRGQIGVTEADMETLTHAALTLLESGHTRLAYRVDDLARHVNAALTRSSMSPIARSHRVTIKAADIESPLESIGKRERGNQKVVNP